MTLESRRLHGKNLTDFKQDVKQIKIKFMSPWLGDEGSKFPSTYLISICIVMLLMTSILRKEKS